ncbi:dephospho-CoA kinase [Cyclobacterium lianum]|uniref:Dephospho-CoA kinase n=1 Tax=Cyclobacterium lianum TaxID=388280 RepID=A0A1M7Q3J9_9BACT|nr:dephospho-CoA kinase [Cyclobacterium lianum]SHN24847.1 dephospho-CoA kinase [Cyclobacterium lianum]
MSRPVLVGISGGIGAGKTLVCRIFSLLEVPIYNADENARWLMAHEPTLKSEIRAAFGSESYLSDGSLNRKYLADKVFSDPVLTKRINALVHPAVQSHFKDWAQRQESTYVLKEAALLFETGSYQELDLTIHVTAPRALRTQRIRKRDPHRSDSQIDQIMKKQWKDNKKNNMADVVLYNDEQRLVIPQVIEIHRLLLAGKF